MINWKKIKLDTAIIMDDDDMARLNIPKIIPDDKDHENDTEVWKFCNFNRHPKFNKKKKYIVSTFGRVFNVKTGKLVTISDSTGYSENCNGVRYKRFTVNINGKSVMYYMHNMVAYTFLEYDDSLHNVVVDHKDENPTHNYVWNLQFVTRSQNTGLHNMRAIQNLKDTGTTLYNKDKDGNYTIEVKPVNGSFTDDEIRHICYMIADGHKATWIYNKLKEEYPDDPKIEYERIRTLYKHIMGKRHSFKEIAKECGVIYPEESGVNPYLKEAGSVANNNTNDNTNNK